MSCRTIERTQSGRGALLLVPLLAVAIGLVIYFGRFGGRKSYVETVLDSKKQAQEKLQQTSLAGLYRFLQQYAAAADGKFPATAQDLAREASLPSGVLFTGRPLEEHKYIYLGGQDESMPPGNLLIYEAAARRDGTCEVLRLGGQVELLTAQQVRDAIAETQKYLPVTRQPELPEKRGAGADTPA